MSRTCRTSVVLVLGLLLATAAAPVAQAAGPGPTAEDSQRKKKRCKAGQIKERIKVGKRTRTRCVARKRAWPAPKAVDMRTESTSYVLGTNFAKVRDRRGRKAKSLPKLLKRIHPRAERALEAAARAGLARMDVRAGASQAGLGCGGPSATVSSTFNAGGGQSVDLTMTGGPDASLQLGLESNQGNKRARIEIEFPGCESHNFESCPTADGVIRGEDNRTIGVKATLTEGSTVVWSQGIRLQGRTTFRGVVDDNAKLDFFEPHNTEVGTLTMGGANRGFSPVSIRMLVQRITRVEYPERTYQLGASTVNATITSPDLSGAALTATEHQIERGMREQADQQFRDIIDKAIRKYDAAETHWNSENTCASIALTPAPNTKTLRRGETGGFEARTDAKPGGSPGRATWTLSGSGNANFSPAGATSNPASFTHGPPFDVTFQVPVTATVRSVSKAGVAQATWSQPTGDTTVNRIEGTFGGTQNNNGSIISWSGTATYVRSFPGPGADGHFTWQASQYTVTASGLDGSGATTCTQSGSKTITGGSGDIDVSGTPPDRSPPYTYTGTLHGPPMEATSMKVMLSNCPEGAEEWNGKEVDVTIAFAPFDVEGQVSNDGVAFAGSLTEAFGALSVTWNWNLTGSP